MLILIKTRSFESSNSFSYRLQKWGYLLFFLDINYARSTKMNYVSLEIYLMRYTYVGIAFTETLINAIYSTIYTIGAPQKELSKQGAEEKRRALNASSGREWQRDTDIYISTYRPQPRFSALWKHPYEPAGWQGRNRNMRWLRRWNIRVS